MLIRNSTRASLWSLCMILSLFWTTTLAFAPSFGRPHQSRTRIGLHAEHFDMDELRHRIQQERTPEIFDTARDPPMTPPSAVHVILFHPGTTKQGAHTIEFPKGSGNNVILAFCSAEASHKFADQLKEQSFLDPTPQEFELDALQEICDSLGVFVQVVPEGVELIPPSQNVKSFGHNPTLRNHKEQLEYIYAMMDDGSDVESALEEEWSSTGDRGDDSWLGGAESVWE